MKELRDSILEFIPSKDVNFVILGTMASYIARDINGEPAQSSFYYHSPRNRFWCILSRLLTGKRIIFSDIEEKKAFLNNYGIAVANIVFEAEIEDKINSSEDKYLFEAMANDRLRFKECSSKFKQILYEKPILFTCRRKSKIELLLKRYFIKNQIPISTLERIHFLHSPTRKSCDSIFRIWYSEMQVLGLEFKGE